MTSPLSGTVPLAELTFARSTRVAVPQLEAQIRRLGRPVGRHIADRLASDPGAAKER
jgi:hypothetical protein